MQLNCHVFTWLLLLLSSHIIVNKWTHKLEIGIIFSWIAITLPTIQWLIWFCGFIADDSMENTIFPRVLIVSFRSLVISCNGRFLWVRCRSRWVCFKWVLEIQTIILVLVPKMRSLRCRYHFLIKLVPLELRGDDALQSLLLYHLLLTWPLFLLFDSALQFEQLDYGLRCTIVNATLFRSLHSLILQ